MTRPLEWTVLDNINFLFFSQKFFAQPVFTRMDPSLVCNKVVNTCWKIQKLKLVIGMLN